MKKFWKKIWKVILRFFYKSAEDYVFIHSAYSTLFVFLSLFPILMLLFVILSHMNIGWDLVLTELDDFVPVAFHDFLVSVMDGLAEKSSGFILSFSIVFTLWSASGGVYGIMLGLNDIYRTYDTRSYVYRRALCLLYTFFLLAAIALSLILIGYGNALLTLIEEKLPAAVPVIHVINTYRYPVTFLYLTGAFTFFYWIMPNIKTRFFDHFPGAMAAALGWVLLTYVYSLYVDYFAVNSLYGSLTTIILFILWLRYIMILFFCGGEINAMRHDARYGKDTSELRSLNRKHILETERSIKEKRPMTSTEKYQLRKTTTRRANLKRLARGLGETLQGEEDDL